MGTILVAIGTYIVYAICAIVLAVAGLGTTKPGQGILTTINDFLSIGLPNVMVCIFDVLLAIPFLVIPEMIVVCICAIVTDGKLRRLPIAGLGLIIVPIWYNNINQGIQGARDKAFCTLLALIVFLAAAGFLWYWTFSEYTSAKEKKQKEAQGLVSPSGEDTRTNPNGNSLQISNLHIGDKVVHSYYGAGVVVGTKDKGPDSIVTVAFDNDASVRHLLLGKSPLRKLGTQDGNVTADNNGTQSLLSVEELSIRAIAQACGVEKAEDGQPNYHGYKLVDNDLSSEPDPLWNTAVGVNLKEAKDRFRLYGVPGGGLSDSDFSSNEVKSGQKGETVLARMIVANCHNVVSFWSLHGLDSQGRSTVADIDCVIAGQDKQGRTHLWFVDAKNYKGGGDTAYRNITSTRLLRACISQHAFENGPDGRPDLELSGNMNWQRGNWNSVLNGKPIIAEWLVCMVPTTNKGVPDVAGVFWPGNIPCVTPEELVERVNAVDLDSVQNIPLDTLLMLKGRLKKR